MLASSVQGFKRVRVREAVVLTPECTAANSKPCIFPAALSPATNWADSGYYPACWEKDTDDYRCATEVKYDEVKINLLLNKACHAVCRYVPYAISRQENKLLEATEVSSCTAGCIGFVPSSDEWCFRQNFQCSGDGDRILGVKKQVLTGLTG